jgi:ABC-type sugar transport system ATPase subunit
VLGVEELLEKGTDQLSGGQKKRIALYCAITSDASVLLLDEVLSEVSSTNEHEMVGGWRKRILGLLSIVARERIVILVGHGLQNDLESSVIKLALT